ncbi:MAG: glycosyltransferase family 2 protein [Candidatus Kapabacteria bacterium]|nr:glycosyltransferase family 2 protein [Candidatus Kapabacteria bacterium]
MSASISVVVPVMNEQDNVGPLHAEILEVCRREGYDFEIIYVDDGSSDATVDVLRTLSPVKVVELRRNFGQTAAMDAGIKASTKELIVTMDGDRQNDPNDIPMLITTMRQQRLDVISGWRKNRQDPFAKNFVSRGANLLRKILINDGIHDSGCSLKVYKRDAFEGLTLYGEMHRFIPAILKIKGYRVGEAVVSHRARTAGETKYNYRRTLKGLIDMTSVWFWNKYAVRPLHLLGGIGLLFMLMGSIAGMFAVVEVLNGKAVNDSGWALLTTFLFLSGLQLFVAGLLSDIAIKTYFGSTRDVSYSIANEFTNE